MVVSAPLLRTATHCHARARSCVSFPKEAELCCEQRGAARRRRVPRTSTAHVLVHVARGEDLAGPLVNVLGIEYFDPRVFHAWAAESRLALGARLTDAHKRPGLARSVREGVWRGPRRDRVLDMVAARREARRLVRRRVERDRRVRCLGTDAVTREERTDRGMLRNCLCALRFELASLVPAFNCL